MRAGNIKLLDLLGSKSGGERTFNIPVYQRNYDWERDQCSTLFKDIVDSAKSGHNHFLGTILYIPEAASPIFGGSFTIIDGQQRLTTIMLLLRAIMDTTENQTLKDKIYKNYLTNPESPHSHLRLELKPLKQESSNFQKLMDNPNDCNVSSRVLENYNLFIAWINESKASNTSPLSPEDIYTGIENLEIVFIELGKDEENPQLVFESINSTGLALTQADLIRNYLLLTNNYKEQETLYMNYWLKLEEFLPDATLSEYIKDYLTFKKSQILNKDKVYIEFKKFREESNNLTTKEVLDELKTYCEYYSWFKYCKGPNEEINTLLSQLQTLKSTSSYPFLLDIFGNCYKYQTIDEEELIKTLNVILVYIVRRALCDMPVNVYRQIFSTMGKEINDYPTLAMHDKVTNILAKKTGNAIFPNDTILQERLLTRALYNSPYTKFILSNIECVQSNKEPVKVELPGITIEHIMPQTLTEEWKADLGDQYQDIYDKYLHSLGNLTLTGYNTELSNDSFANKKKRYKDSHIGITEAICDIATGDYWGEAEILKRAEWLIDKIKNIWKCPDIVNATTYEIYTKTDFTFFEPVVVKGRTPAQFEFLGEIHSVSSWKDILRILCLELYRRYPEIFRNLSKDDKFVTGKHNKIIRDSKDGIHTPFKIGENLYIETNKGADNILKFCRKILAKFDEDVRDSASFKIKDPTVQ